MGESLDFADYREYHPGDDFRRIDYNLWARLGVVLIRLFEAEDEMPLQVVVDNSASMGFGDKFPTAQRLAAMVAYLGLASGERVRLATVPGSGPAVVAGPVGPARVGLAPARAVAGEPRAEGRHRPAGGGPIARRPRRPSWPRWCW